MKDIAILSNFLTTDLLTYLLTLATSRGAFAPKNTDTVINFSFPPLLIFASDFIFYLITFVKAMRMVETTQFHYPVVFQIL